MADHSDRPSDDWGDQVAKWTFVLSLVLAVFYVGFVLTFVLSR
jgi:hypothetical protein